MTQHLTPLIDGDILLHEIGWSGQFKDKDSGEEVILPTQLVEEMVDKRIADIRSSLTSKKQPILFFSDNEYLARYSNRLSKFSGEQPRVYIPQTRYSIAKSRPYKGTRKNPKPYHFYQLLCHLMSNYSCVVSEGGLEADDEMGIYQNEDTIICSRDKDLKMIPGWHYTWACRNKPASGPTYTDSLGWLEKEGNKIRGYGFSFFCFQLLAGDSVDNIPGLPGIGAVKAYKALEGLSSHEDLISAVKALYEERGESLEYLQEQADLLWIRQERDEGYKV